MGCVRKATITASCVFAFSMALPIVYFLSALFNMKDDGWRASKISQIDNSPCANYQKIDMAWALLVSCAALGTACALLQAYIIFKSGDTKLAKFYYPLCLGPFICACMIVDIWANIPEKCQFMMENSFDNEVPIWTGIQVVVYAFIVGMALFGCGCCCMCCACACGHSLDEMMFLAKMKVMDFNDDDDDFEMPEMFRNPSAFEAKMKKSMAELEKTMKQLEQLEADAKAGNPEAVAKKAAMERNFKNAMMGGKVEV